jgi:hypothetical protein
MIIGGQKMGPIGVGVGVFVYNSKPPGGMKIKKVGVGVAVLFTTGATEVLVGTGVGGPAMMARVLGIQVGVVIVIDIHA